jgi:hypothetical protein
MISPAFRTHDQTMPWQLFGILAADLGHFWALEQLQHREATRHGILLALNPSDPDVRRTHLELGDQAVPVIGEPRPRLVLFGKRE